MCCKKFSNFTDVRLTLSRKNKIVEIERVNVLKVYHIKRKAAKAKYTAIGAGASAGVGLVIGAAKASPRIDDSEIYYLLAIPAAGIGALFGLIAGQARRKRVLIYEAKTAGS